VIVFNLPVPVYNGEILRNDYCDTALYVNDLVQTQRQSDLADGLKPQEEVKKSYQLLN
jgi:hypothetical protein